MFHQYPERGHGIVRRPLTLLRLTEREITYWIVSGGRITCLVRQCVANSLRPVFGQREGNRNTKGIELGGDCPNSC